MTKEREEVLTLEILQAIDGRSDVTQRHLANRMGVALGLANSYLKRCVRKGLIKITQAPANRYLYYLTPQGFAEKTRLTGEYLAASFDFYRRASESVVTALQWCVEHDGHRVLLIGVSELAEIASVRAHDFAVQILGTFDPDSPRASFIGKPVWHHYLEVPRPEVAIYTVLPPARELMSLVASDLAPDRVFVPSIVRPTLAQASTE